jgi:hypothetical protein
LVLCVDEKSQIQVLNRTQPILPMRPGEVERHTPEYQRNGTTSPFAALDVATGNVMGRCFRRHRAVEFKKFLDYADSQVPSAMEKAIKEALLALPAEEHDWFDLHGGGRKKGKAPGAEDSTSNKTSKEPTQDRPLNDSAAEEPSGQKQFFEYSGPLFSVCISPASSVVKNFAGATPGELLERLIELSLYTEENLK